LGGLQAQMKEPAGTASWFFYLFDGRGRGIETEELLSLDIRI
jgi:hypothetical protein